MTIWQRISDQATAVTGSLASLLQRMAGEPAAARDPEKSVAFTIGMVALGAKMAKVDGAVTGDEVTAFKEVFQVEPDELSNVARVFNLAKQDVAGYDDYARQIESLFGDQPEVLEDVVDGLFHIAKADGALNGAELDYLKSVSDIFGLSERFRCIKARHIVAPEDDPYVVLGVDPCVTDDELKRLYRQMVRESHPDRHLAAGMPPELIRIANDRLAAINSAYEEIAVERGL